MNAGGDSNLVANKIWIAYGRQRLIKRNFLPSNDNNQQAQAPGRQM